jgi:protein SCO1/2
MLKLIGIGFGIILATQAWCVSGRTSQKELSPAPVPVDPESVEIIENLGAQLPLDLNFQNEAGNTIRLGDYFKSGRPVILNFAYYRCPMLCNLVSQGMVDGLKPLEWVPSKQFEVITLSVDHRETSELAAGKKASSLEALGKPEAAQGWHFLTGDSTSIAQLAEVAGFQYKYVPETNDFAHAAGLLVATPEGKMARYLYGVQFRAKDMRLALLDAAEGKSLSIGEKILLFCYAYDADAKGYVLWAQKFMKGGGILTLILVGGLLGYLWMRELKPRDFRKSKVASAVGADDSRLG